MRIAFLHPPILWCFALYVLGFATRLLYGCAPTLPVESPGYPGRLQASLTPVTRKPIGPDIPIGAPPQSDFSSSWLVRLGSQPLKIKARHIEEQEAAQGFDNLLRQPQDMQNTRPRELWSMQMSLPVVSDRLKTESEIAYGLSDAADGESMSLSGGRLMRFGIKGHWEGFNYGAEFRSVGERFVNLKGPAFPRDRKGGEIWSERQLGPLKIRGLYSEFWNNLEGDPSRPEISEVKAGLVSELAAAHWPILRFSYFRTRSSSAAEPEGYLPQLDRTDAFRASLFYREPVWEMRWSSTQSFTEDELGLGKDKDRFVQMLAATVRPTKLVSITPRIHITDEKSGSAGSRSLTPAASLLLRYHLADRFNLNASATARKTFNEEQEDSRHFKLTSGFSWKWYREDDRRNGPELSFNLSYKRKSSGAIRTEDAVSGWILFRLGSF